MCVVSYISPIKQNNDLLWEIDVNKTWSYKPKNAFDVWTFEQCVAYVELLEKAQAFDEVNNEPHCDDPQKTVHLRELLTRIRDLGLNGFNKKEALELSIRLETVMEKLNK